MITGDKVIKSYEEEIKTIARNFNEKQNFHFLLAIWLITITLLIAVSIFCYVIKYQTKHLLPFHCINNQSKSILMI